MRQLIVLNSVLVAGLCGIGALAQSDPLTARTDFQNLIYTNTPTLASDTSLTNSFNAAVSFCSGNIGAATNELVASTNIVRPNDGPVYLLASAIGQPVGMFTVPFNLSIQGSGKIVPTPHAYAAGSWYQLHQTVSLQPVAARYHAFSNWTDLNTNNPRTVIAGATNSYTAVFVTTNDLETITNSGLVRVAPLGTPVVLLNGEFHPDDVLVTNDHVQVLVTLVTSYPGGKIRFSLDGIEPSTTHGALYSNSFTAQTPFEIQAKAYRVDDSDPKLADPVTTLNAFSPGGGTVSAIAATDFTTGDAAAVVTANPAAGWTFMNWRINDVNNFSELSPIITVAMADPQKVEAVFGRSVVASVFGSGYVTNDPPQALYPFNTIVHLAAVPASSSYFDTWAGGAVIGSVSPADFFVTNSSQSVQAVFGTLPSGSNTLTVVTIGEGDVSRVPFSSYYPAGGSVSLTANVRSGYSFDHWGGDAYGSSSNLSVTMTNSKLIYASFVPTQPTFVLSASRYDVNEAEGAVAITVINQGKFGTNVILSTADLTALGGLAGAGDYEILTTNLVFSSGPSNQTVLIPIRDKFLLQAMDKKFQVSLSNPGSGGTLGSPSSGTVFIHYNDSITTIGSLLTQAYPTAAPQTVNSLTTFLSPANAAGQWRFPWEDGWRLSGESATNLEAGRYDLEFRTMLNYVPLPPASLPWDLAAGDLTVPCFPSSGKVGFGTVTVGFATNAINNGGRWRLRGERTWRTNHEVAYLLPGTYGMEFLTLPGLSAPVVSGNNALSVPPSNHYIYDTISYSSAAPLTDALPSPLSSFSLINVTAEDTPRLPYVFNGQLRSSVNGYGSGVAVRSNVVLTAAHLVFNDNTLSYVGPVYWFFQRHQGGFNPKPLVARGWNVLSSYAAARTNDLPPLGSLSPGVSSAQSRNSDVAALYFNGPVARGGFGGYLASDETTNEWLTGPYQKMLVGYPVDASAEGYTDVVAGAMHATATNSYIFTRQNDRVYGCTEFRSFAGNSGGPLYVQYTNGIFYPAAVYLGQNAGSLVRAIDSSVVNLIVRSALLGDSGTNQTGGGVVTLTAFSVSPANPAYLQIRIGPEAAINAGASWGLLGDTEFATYTPDLTRILVTNSTAIVFKSITNLGWIEPASQALQITNTGGLNIPDQVFYYTPAPPVMTLDSVQGLRITGTIGTTYQIEYRTNLAAGDWLPLQIKGLPAGSSLILPWPPTNGLPTAFYRAVWLP